ncbi:MAG: hypothetical protein IJ575_11450 [Selenomonadaceae bacterium]|nr:hypothetical protein [Selenomonadaceae bacterium]
MNDRERFDLALSALENFDLKTEIELLTPIQDPEFKRLAAGLLTDAYYLSGDPDRAASILQQFHEPEVYSKYLFLKNYRETNPLITRARAEVFGNFFENPNPIPRNKKSKLRIGIISSDLREHAVSNFVRPFLNLDSKKFLVQVFSTGRIDSVTKILQKSKVKWHDLFDRDSTEIFDLIRREKIDILIDLAGHSQGNRLEIFAYRAAPIQICAIGYTATTGLKSMDYFLTDEICGESAEDHFTEKLLKLKNCHLCYSPLKIFPETKKSPRNFISFGSFNNIAKLTDEILTAWSQILSRIQNSKLIIKAKICSIQSGREILIERLNRLKLPIDRIELRPFSQNYLEDYRDVDISLDTFPYQGGLTTIESLVMDTPVITIRGNSHGSRFGASILTNANLSELIAENLDEYVEKAIDLAKNPDRIKDYRKIIFNSPLTDSKQYTRDLEKCLLQIWNSKEDF